MSLILPPLMFITTAQIHVTWMNTVKAEILEL